MSSLTPCPTCGHEVPCAGNLSESNTLRCPACETVFVVPGEAANAPAAIALQDSPAGTHWRDASATQPVQDASAGQSPSPAELWQWAEDGGPVVVPAAAANYHQNEAAANIPLAIDVEPPSIAQGAVGPYLAFSDASGDASANRERPRATRRVSRREPGLLSHLVGVIGGGVLGLGIAYYLLNWFGGPQYNFLELELPGLASQAADEELDETTAEVPAWRRLSDDKPSERRMFDADAENVSEPTSSEPAVETSAATIETPAPAAGPAAGLFGVRNGPTFTSDNLRAALHAAQDAASMTAEAFDSLCQLAQVVTFLDEQADSQRDARLKAISTLAEKIEARPGALDQLSKLAVERMDNHNGPPKGIAFAGTMTTAGRQGHLHRYEFSLDGAAKTVTVISRLPASLVPSDHVLVLGSIVNDPATHLSGYEGQLPQVIWGGWHVKLNPPASE